MACATGSTRARGRQREHVLPVAWLRSHLDVGRTPPPPGVRPSTGRGDPTRLGSSPDRGPGCALGHAPVSELRVVAHAACQIAEAPLWHPEERRLYWVDAPAGRLFRLDPGSGAYELAYAGEPIGGLCLRSDGALLLFQARGAIRMWRRGHVRTLLEEIPEERATSFNDVIAAPGGRVLAGVMAVRGPYGEVMRAGRLYRIERDLSRTLVLEGPTVPNGMGFAPGCATLYFSDSRAHEISRFDYDRSTGALTGRRCFVRTRAGEGRPDGLTVDDEGHVWSASWDGGCVVRYRPDGTEARRIPLPVRKVSSLAFGGDGYSDLFITTAGGGTNAEHPLAGAIFHIRPGVRGVPEFRSLLGL